MSSSFPNEDLSSGFQPLRVKHAGQLVIEAEQELRRSSGVQFALKTRWAKLNKAFGGGFQFGNIYLIAAASGSGKSYVRNMLEQDFHNPDLNGTYPDKYLSLVFQFEMTGASETIRTLSGKTGYSYGELMSAEKPFADLRGVKTVRYSTWKPAVTASKWRRPFTPCTRSFPITSSLSRWITAY